MGLIVVVWVLLNIAQAAEPVYQRSENTAPAYHYVIDQVTAVVDGDTVDVRLDMGFQIEYRVRVRLAGLDTPEKTGEQKVAGLAVAGWVARWFAAQKGPLYLASHDWDKFGGRVLGDVQLQDGTSLTALLIKRGLGRPYQGAAKKPWTEAELAAATAAALDKP